MTLPYIGFSWSPFLGVLGLGIAWEEAPLMYEKLKDTGITTLRHLLELAEAHLINAVTLEQRLEV